MTYIDFGELVEKLEPEDILERLGVGKITRSGNELRCACPVHGGKKPNFAVNTDTKSWFCHSRNCHGKDLLDLYARARDLDLRQAAEELSKGIGGYVARPKPQPTANVKSYTFEDVKRCWEEASPQGVDTYFSRKKLSPPPIARFGKNPKGYQGTLIPYRDIDGDLKMVLSCADGKFNFKAADSYKGSFAILGVLKPSEAFYIGEGIATTQTVWEASERQITAVSCGSWSNMLPVMRSIKEKHPKSKPIVLIDCDSGGSGIAAAKEILKEFPDTTFRKPSFEGLPNSSEAKDFNDLISVCGQDLTEVKRQLMIETELKEKETQEETNNELLPIIPLSERLNLHKEYLKKHRGKKYLGLRVKTLKEINENLKGLRQLVLLAAAPNVGKTALTIQVATEVLQTEENACLVFISLEMTEKEIFTRMNLYLSGLSFDTYVMGSKKIENDEEILSCFTEEEIEKINQANEELNKIGDRLQILDASLMKFISAEKIIQYIERLKEETKCNRVIVIVDYLQVWPIPEGIRFTSDLEADKWRIGEIKKVRDAINKENEDPIIVISEARKPPPTEEVWGGGLSDVMGSARSTYTPDVVMLLSQLSPKAIKKLWDEKKMPAIEKGDNFDHEGEAIISRLSKDFGISICKLKIDKGRDGMKRFTNLIAFHFQKNTFSEINWYEIKEEITRGKRK